jgi:hypothetical protein
LLNGWARAEETMATAVGKFSLWVVVALVAIVIVALLLVN